MDQQKISTDNNMWESFVVIYRNDWQGKIELIFWAMLLEGYTEVVNQ